MISDFHKQAQERNVFKRLRTYKLRMLKRPTRGERRFKRLFFQATKGSIYSALKLKKQRIFLNANTGYIADFFLPEFKLVIEIDGPSHDDNQAYDNKRTLYFAKRGIKVVRFSNTETSKHSECIKRIRSVIFNREQELIHKLGQFTSLLSKQEQRNQINILTQDYIKKGKFIKPHKLRKKNSP